MFWNTIRFRVVIQHSTEAAVHVRDLLNANGITVYDVREADIVGKTDKSKKGSAYVLCCKGSRKLYDALKKKFNYQEVRYEHFKTLI